MNPISYTYFSKTSLKGAPESQKEPPVDRSFLVRYGRQNGGFRYITGQCKTVQ